MTATSPIVSLQASTLAALKSVTTTSIYAGVSLALISAGSARFDSSDFMAITTPVGLSLTSVGDNVAISGGAGVLVKAATIVELMAAGDMSIYGGTGATVATAPLMSLSILSGNELIVATQASGYISVNGHLSTFANTQLDFVSNGNINIYAGTQVSFTSTTNLLAQVGGQANLQIGTSFVATAAAFTSLVGALSFVTESNEGPWIARSPTGLLSLQADLSIDISTNGPMRLDTRSGLSLFGSTQLIAKTLGPLSISAVDRIDVSTPGAVSLRGSTIAVSSTTDLALAAATLVSLSAGTTLALTAPNLVVASSNELVSLYSANSILINAANGPLSFYTLHVETHSAQEALSFYGGNSLALVSTVLTGEATDVVSFHGANSIALAGNQLAYLFSADYTSLGGANSMTLSTNGPLSLNVGNFYQSVANSFALTAADTITLASTTDLTGLIAGSSQGAVSFFAATSFISKANQIQLQTAGDYVSSFGTNSYMTASNVLMTASTSIYAVTSSGDMSLYSDKTMEVIAIGTTLLQSTGGKVSLIAGSDLVLDTPSSAFVSGYTTASFHGGSTATLNAALVAVVQGGDMASVYGLNSLMETSNTIVIEGLDSISVYGHNSILLKSEVNSVIDSGDMISFFAYSSFVAATTVGPVSLTTASNNVYLIGGDATSLYGTNSILMLTEQNMLLEANMMLSLQAIHSLALHANKHMIMGGEIMTSIFANGVGSSLLMQSAGLTSIGAANSLFVGVTLGPLSIFATDEIDLVSSSFFANINTVASIGAALSLVFNTPDHIDTAISRSISAANGLYTFAPLTSLFAANAVQMATTGDYSLFAAVSANTLVGMEFQVGSGNLLSLGATVNLLGVSDALIHLKAGTMASLYATQSVMLNSNNHLMATANGLALFQSAGELASLHGHSLYATANVGIMRFAAQTTAEIVAGTDLTVTTGTIASVQAGSDLVLIAATGSASIVAFSAAILTSTGSTEVSGATGLSLFTNGFHQEFAATGMSLYSTTGYSLTAAQMTTDIRGVASTYAETDLLLHSNIQLSLYGNSVLGLVAGDDIIFGTAILTGGSATSIYSGSSLIMKSPMTITLSANEAISAYGASSLIQKAGVAMELSSGQTITLSATQGVSTYGALSALLVSGTAPGTMGDVYIDARALTSLYGGASLLARTAGEAELIAGAQLSLVGTTGATLDVMAATLSLTASSTVGLGNIMIGAGNLVSLYGGTSIVANTIGNVLITAPTAASIISVYGAGSMLVSNPYMALDTSASGAISLFTGTHTLSVAGTTGIYSGLDLTASAQNTVSFYAGVDFQLKSTFNAIVNSAAALSLSASTSIYIGSSINNAQVGGGGIFIDASSGTGSGWGFVSIAGANSLIGTATTGVVSLSAPQLVTGNMLLNAGELVSLNGANVQIRATANAGVSGTGVFAAEGATSILSGDMLTLQATVGPVHIKATAGSASFVSSDLIQLTGGQSIAMDAGKALLITSSDTVSMYSSKSIFSEALEVISAKSSNLILLGATGAYSVFTGTSLMSTATAASELAVTAANGYSSISAPSFFIQSTDMIQMNSGNTLSLSSNYYMQLFSNNYLSLAANNLLVQTAQFYSLYGANQIEMTTNLDMLLTTGNMYSLVSSARISQESPLVTTIGSTHVSTYGGNVYTVTGSTGEASLFAGNINLRAGEMQSLYALNNIFALSTGITVSATQGLSFFGGTNIMLNAANFIDQTAVSLTATGTFIYNAASDIHSLFGANNLLLKSAAVSISGLNSVVLASDTHVLLRTDGLNSIYAGNSLYAIAAGGAFVASGTETASIYSSKIAALTSAEVTSLYGFQKAILTSPDVTSVFGQVSVFLSSDVMLLATSPSASLFAADKASLSSPTLTIVESNAMLSFYGATSLITIANQVVATTVNLLTSGSNIVSAYAAVTHAVTAGPSSQNLVGDVTLTAFAQASIFGTNSIVAVSNKYIELIASDGWISLYSYNSLMASSVNLIMETSNTLSAYSAVSILARSSQYMVEASGTASLYGNLAATVVSNGDVALTSSGAQLSAFASTDIVFTANTGAFSAAGRNMNLASADQMSIYSATDIIQKAGNFQVTTGIIPGNLLLAAANTFSVYGCGMVYDFTGGDAIHRSARYTSISAGSTLILGATGITSIYSAELINSESPTISFRASSSLVASSNMVEVLSEETLSLYAGASFFTAAANEIFLSSNALNLNGKLAAYIVSPVLLSLQSNVDLVAEATMSVSFYGSAVYSSALSTLTTASKLISIYGSDAVNIVSDGVNGNVLIQSNSMVSFYSGDSLMFQTAANGVLTSLYGGKSIGFMAENLIELNAGGFVSLAAVGNDFIMQAGSLVSIWGGANVASKAFVEASLTAPLVKLNGATSVAIVGAEISTIASGGIFESASSTISLVSTNGVILSGVGSVLATAPSVSLVGSATINLLSSAGTINSKAEQLIGVATANLVLQGEATSLFGNTALVVSADALTSVHANAALVLQGKSSLQLTSDNGYASLVGSTVVYVGSKAGPLYAIANGIASVYAGDNLDLATGAAMRLISVGDATISTSAGNARVVSSGTFSLYSGDNAYQITTGDTSFYASGNSATSLLGNTYFQTSGFISLLTGGQILATAPAISLGASVGPMITYSGDLLSIHALQSIMANAGAAFAVKSSATMELQSSVSLSLKSNDLVEAAAENLLSLYGAKSLVAFTAGNALLDFAKSTSLISGEVLNIIAKTSLNANIADGFYAYTVAGPTSITGASSLILRAGTADFIGSSNAGILSLYSGKGLYFNADAGPASLYTPNGYGVTALGTEGVSIFANTGNVALIAPLGNFVATAGDGISGGSMSLYAQSGFSAVTPGPASIYSTQLIFNTQTGSASIYTGAAFNLLAVDMINARGSAVSLYADTYLNVAVGGAASLLAADLIVRSTATQSTYAALELLINTDTTMGLTAVGLVSIVGGTSLLAKALAGDALLLASVGSVSVAAAGNTVLFANTGILSFSSGSDAFIESKGGSVSITSSSILDSHAVNQHTIRGDVSTSIFGAAVQIVADDFVYINSGNTISFGSNGISIVAATEPLLLSATVSSASLFGATGVTVQSSDATAGFAVITAPLFASVYASGTTGTAVLSSACLALVTGVRTEILGVNSLNLISSTQLTAAGGDLASFFGSNSVQIVSAQVVLTAAPTLIYNAASRVSIDSLGTAGFTASTILSLYSPVEVDILSDLNIALKAGTVSVSGATAALVESTAGSVLAYSPLAAISLVASTSIIEKALAGPIAIHASGTSGTLSLIGEGALILNSGGPYSLTAPTFWTNIAGDASLMSTAGNIITAASGSLSLSSSADAYLLSSATVSVRGTIGLELSTPGELATISMLSATGLMTLGSAGSLVASATAINIAGSTGVVIQDLVRASLYGGVTLQLVGGTKASLKGIDAAAGQVEIGASGGAGLVSIYSGGALQQAADTQIQTAAPLVSLYGSATLVLATEASNGVVSISAPTTVFTAFTGTTSITASSLVTLESLNTASLFAAALVGITTPAAVEVSGGSYVSTLGVTGVTQTVATGGLSLTAVLGAIRMSAASTVEVVSTGSHVSVIANTGLILNGGTSFIATSTAGPLSLMALSGPLALTTSELLTLNAGTRLDASAMDVFYGSGTTALSLTSNVGPFFAQSNTQLSLVANAGTVIKALSTSVDLSAFTDMTLTSGSALSLTSTTDMQLNSVTQISLTSASNLAIATTALGAPITLHSTGMLSAYAAQSMQFSSVNVLSLYSNTVAAYALGGVSIVGNGGVLVGSDGKLALASTAADIALAAVTQVSFYSDAKIYDVSDTSISTTTTLTSLFSSGAVNIVGTTGLSFVSKSGDFTLSSEFGTGTVSMYGSRVAASAGHISLASTAGIDIYAATYASLVGLTAVKIASPVAIDINAPFASLYGSNSVALGSSTLLLLDTLTANGISSVLSASLYLTGSNMLSIRGNMNTVLYDLATISLYGVAGVATTGETLTRNAGITIYDVAPAVSIYANSATATLDILSDTNALIQTVSVLSLYGGTNVQVSAGNGIAPTTGNILIAAQQTLSLYSGLKMWSNANAYDVTAATVATIAAAEGLSLSVPITAPATGTGMANMQGYQVSFYSGTSLQLRADSTVDIISTTQSVYASAATGLLLTTSTGNAAISAPSTTDGSLSFSAGLNVDITTSSIVNVAASGSTGVVSFYAGTGISVQGGGTTNGNIYMNAFDSVNIYSETLATLKSSTLAELSSTSTAVVYSAGLVSLYSEVESLLYGKTTVNVFGGREVITQSNAISLSSKGAFASIIDLDTDGAVSIHSTGTAIGFDVSIPAGSVKISAGDALSLSSSTILAVSAGTDAKFDFTGVTSLDARSGLYIYSTSGEIITRAPGAIVHTSTLSAVSIIGQTFAVLSANDINFGVASVSGGGGVAIDSSGTTGYIGMTAGAGVSINAAASISFFAGTELYAGSTAAGVSIFGRTQAALYGESTATVMSAGGISFISTGAGALTSVMGSSSLIAGTGGQYITLASHQMAEVAGGVSTTAFLGILAKSTTDGIELNGATSATLTTAGTLYLTASGTEAQIIASSTGMLSLAAPSLMATFTNEVQLVANTVSLVGKTNALLTSPVAAYVTSDGFVSLAAGTAVYIGSPTTSKLAFYTPGSTSIVSGTTLMLSTGDDAPGIPKLYADTTSMSLYGGTSGLTLQALGILSLYSAAEITTTSATSTSIFAGTTLAMHSNAATSIMSDAGILLSSIGGTSLVTSVAAGLLFATPLSSLAFSTTDEGTLHGNAALALSTGGVLSLTAVGGLQAVGDYVSTYGANSILLSAQGSGVLSMAALTSLLMTSASEVSLFAGAGAMHSVTSNAVFSAGGFLSLTAGGVGALMSDAYLSLYGRDSIMFATTQTEIVSTTATYVSSPITSLYGKDTALLISSTTGGASLVGGSLATVKAIGTNGFAVLSAEGGGGTTSVYALVDRVSTGAGMHSIFTAASQYQLLVAEGTLSFYGAEALRVIAGASLYASAVTDAIVTGGSTVSLATTAGLDTGTVGLYTDGTLSLSGNKNIYTVSTLGNVYTSLPMGNYNVEARQITMAATLGDTTLSSTDGNLAFTGKGATMTSTSVAGTLIDATGGATTLQASADVQIKSVGGSIVNIGLQSFIASGPLGMDLSAGSAGSLYMGAGDALVTAVNLLYVVASAGPAYVAGSTITSLVGGTGVSIMATTSAGVGITATAAVEVTAATTVSMFAGTDAHIQSAGFLSIGASSFAMTASGGSAGNGMLSISSGQTTYKESRFVLYSAGSLSTLADASITTHSAEYTSLFSGAQIYHQSVGDYVVSTMGNIQLSAFNVGAYTSFYGTEVVGLASNIVSFYSGTAGVVIGGVGAIVSVSGGNALVSAESTSIFASASTGGVHVLASGASGSVYMKGTSHTVIESGTGMTSVYGLVTSLVSGMTMAMSGAADVYIESSGTATVGTSGLVSMFGANSIGITTTSSTGALLLSSGNLASFHGANSVMFNVGDTVAGLLSMHSPVTTAVKGVTALTLEGGTHASVYGGQSLFLSTIDTLAVTSKTAAGVINGILSFQTQTGGPSGSFDLMASGAGVVSAAALSVISSGNLVVSSQNTLQAVGTTGVYVQGGVGHVSAYSSAGLFLTSGGATAANPMSFYAGSDFTAVAGGTGHMITGGAVGASVYGGLSLALFAGLPTVTDPEQLSRIDLLVGSISFSTKTRIDLVAATTTSGKTATLMVGGTAGTRLETFSAAATSLYAATDFIASASEISSIHGTLKTSVTTGAEMVIASTDPLAGAVKVTAFNTEFGASAAYTTTAGNGGGMVRISNAGLYVSARSGTRITGLGPPVTCEGTIETENFFRSAIFVISPTCPALSTFILPIPIEEGQRQVVIWDMVVTTATANSVIYLSWGITTTGATFTVQINPRTAYEVISYRSCEGAAETDATYGTCSGGPLVWAVVGAYPYLPTTVPRPFTVS